MTKIVDMPAIKQHIDIDVGRLDANHVSVKGNQAPPSLERTEIQNQISQLTNPDLAHNSLTNKTLVAGTTVTAVQTLVAANGGWGAMARNVGGRLVNFAGMTPKGFVVKKVGQVLLTKVLPGVGLGGAGIYATHPSQSDSKLPADAATHEMAFPPRREYGVTETVPIDRQAGKPTIHGGAQPPDLAEVPVGYQQHDGSVNTVTPGRAWLGGTDTREVGYKPIEGLNDITLLSTSAEKTEPKRLNELPIDTSDVVLQDVVLSKNQKVAKLKFYDQSTGEFFTARVNASTGTLYIPFDPGKLSWLSASAKQANTTYPDAAFHDVIYHLPLDQKYGHNNVSYKDRLSQEPFLSIKRDYLNDNREELGVFLAAGYISNFTDDHPIRDLLSHAWIQQIRFDGETFTFRTADYPDKQHVATHIENGRLKPTAEAVKRYMSKVRTLWK